LSSSAHITEINEISQFFELEREWNKTLEKSRDNHIFLTWEFMSTYMKHFGKEKQLRILCVEDKNKTIAIAPLRQSRYNLANRFSYNVIEPLAYMHSDYTGIILAEREAECLKLFLNYFFEQDDWDFIYLYDIPRTSIIPELLPKVSKSIPRFELKQGVVCPYLSLPDSMDILMKGLSPNFRYNLRRYMRKLEKNYRKVEFKRYDEFLSVEEAIKIFIELHQNRWKLKGKPGVYYAQQRRDFSIDVAKAFANNGWLALYFLTANDEPMAALYCLEYNQRMYGGLSGFDPGYSHYSVGNLILAKVLGECIQKKIKEFDFMKGGEPYKFRYTTMYRRNSNFRFVNKRLISNLYHWGFRTVKQMRMERILGRFLEF